MATGAYYRSDGIQNSGTAIRRRNGVNENVEIHNSSGKIYPRQVVESFTASTPTGGYLCHTCRSGYNLNSEKGTWRTDKAYQGYYKGSEGASCHAVGHFFPADGCKINIGGGKILGFTVTYVKIVINRTRGGYSGSTITGKLRQSNLISSFKNGVYRGMRYSDVVLNGAEFVFSWNPIGQNTVLESSDQNSDLCKFIQTFLSDSSVNSICLFNGEGSAGGADYSKNYGSCNSFTIEIKGNKTIQL